MEMPLSSERYDMSCPIGTRRTTDCRLVRAEREAGLPLRCVSSGSPAGCSCRAQIAKDLVARAWARELEAAGDSEARFFHFIADGGVWMAYGLADGDVRGVYCPAHNSRRAERARAASCCAGDVVLELPLAA
jgi:hypothetical protein